MVPESHGEWEDVDEGIDLEHAEEEDTKVLKCFCEEIPEEASVWCLVRDCETGGSKHQWLHLNSSG